jgi:hypothetical protein
MTHDQLIDELLSARWSAFVRVKMIERSIIMIDPNYLFFIVRLRLIKMYSAVANIVYDIIVDYCSKFMILYHTVDLNQQISI